MIGFYSPSGLMSKQKFGLLFMLKMKECTVCYARKHGSRDNSWTRFPGKKLVVDAIKDPGDSKKHDQCRKAGLLSRSSTF